MRMRLWMVLVMSVAGVAMAGCVPVVIGAGAAVIADEAMEQEAGGGDGLF